MARNNNNDGIGEPTAILIYTTFRKSSFGTPFFKRSFGTPFLKGVEKVEKVELNYRNKSLNFVYV